MDHPGHRAYLKETGDLAFLEKVVPYYEKDRTDHPVETGTVLDHMRRAIEFTTAHVGAHGLPLLGFADWNDTVNLPAGAESLFVANLYGKALLEMIDLARHLDDLDAADRYAAYYAGDEGQGQRPGLGRRVVRALLRRRRQPLGLEGRTPTDRSMPTANRGR